MTNKRFPKKNHKQSNLSEGIQACNNLTNIQHLNIQERNSSFLSTILNVSGQELNVSSIGNSEHSETDTIYFQKTELRSPDCETTLAVNEISESKTVLFDIAEHLKLPKVPSIIIEAISLANTLSYIGIKLSNPIHTPLASKEVTVEENLSTLTEKDQTHEEKPAPVLKDTQQEVATNETAEKEPSELIQVEIEQKEPLAPTEKKEISTAEPEPELETEDQPVVITPVTSASKKVNDDPLSVNTASKGDDSPITSNSISKFITVMKALNLSSDAVISFLNLKEDSNEPIPTSISQMTKKQGYRVLNRLKNAVNGKDPDMIRLVESRRETYGGFKIEEVNAPAKGKANKKAPAQQQKSSKSGSGVLDAGKKMLLDLINKIGKGSELEKLISKSIDDGLLGKNTTPDNIEDAIIEISNNTTLTTLISSAAACSLKGN